VSRNDLDYQMLVAMATPSPTTPLSFCPLCWGVGPRQLVECGDTNIVLNAYWESPPEHVARVGVCHPCWHAMTRDGATLLGISVNYFRGQPWT